MSFSYCICFASYLSQQTLLIQHDLKPITVDADGAWLFFDGALKTYFLGADGVGNFTSRQIFKANNPHTGAGRGSTATRE